MPTLDKRKPFRVLVDHHGNRTFMQDGQSYTENGAIITVQEKTVGKFRCCKCDFDCNNKDEMRHHLRDIHGAPQDVMIREIRKMDQIDPPVTKSGEELFKCKHCPSTFQKQLSLVSHMRIHKKKE